jgi:POT family proton-dependent oligopeptide transporter
MNTQVIQHTITQEELKNSLQQPKELYSIFIIEMWERFAYYGMQILLVFFIADYLHLSTAKTIELNGAFIALVYASPTFGGYLADRYLGIKRTLLTGALLLAFGYFFLAMIAMTSVKNLFTNINYYLAAFYWALGIIAIGNGCFKPNPTSLLSKVYKPNDPRIDAGYTIFYMSINIGSLFSLLLTPIIHAYVGYTPAFLTCSFGLILGLAYFSFKLKDFRSYGVEADFASITIFKVITAFISILCLTVLAAYLLSNLVYARALIMLTVIYVFSMFLYYGFTLPKQDGNKVLAILILLGLTAVFFSLQLQMFGVLNIFIDQHVMRNFMGYEIPAGNYAALNAIWVALLGPFMARFYLYLEDKKMPVTIPTRFSIGLLLSSAGFYYLSLCSYYAVDGMISSWWIINSYFIISLGELLVSALGLALICKLAPPKLTTVFMGAFLLSIAIGGWISGLIGHWIVIPDGVTDMQIMIEAYSVAFFKVGNMSLIAGLFSLAILPFLIKLTGEKKITEEIKA